MWSTILALLLATVAVSSWLYAAANRTLAKVTAYFLHAEHSLREIQKQGVLDSKNEEDWLRVRLKFKRDLKG